MTPENLKKIAEKVIEHGTSDLRKLAPIGDIGYLNGIEFYKGDFYRSIIPDAIMKAFWEQKKEYGWTVESKESHWRNTDNSYYCPELELRWAVDSGD